MRKVFSAGLKHVTDVTHFPGNNWDLGVSAEVPSTAAYLALELQIQASGYVSQLAPTLDQ